MIQIRHDNDFELILSFSNASGQEINPATQRFRFLYSDVCGNTCEVSFDGTNRINNYEQDGKVYGTISRNTFQKGALIRSEYYTAPSTHFPDGIWQFGNTYQTNIEIV